MAEEEVKQGIGDDKVLCVEGLGGERKPSTAVLVAFKGETLLERISDFLDKSIYPTPSQMLQMPKVWTYGKCM